MAHLWKRETPAGWSPVPVKSHDALVAAEGEVQLSSAEQGERPAVAAAIVQQGAGPSAQWLLLAPPHSGVWINGSRVPLGIRALHDRDELRIANAEPVYFSTEQLAHVEPFPATDKSVICPRCKQSIEEQTPAVCCGQCHAWYHESAELNCWTYAATCGCCGHATALDAGYRWKPEEL